MKILAKRHQTHLMALTAGALLCATLSGCLKSRLQIREEEEQDSAKPTPGIVEPVHAQGGYALDEIKSEMTRLTGRIEDLERSRQDTTVAQTNAQKDTIKKLEARMIDLEQAQANMIEVIKKIQETRIAAVAESPEGFEKAKSRLDANDYDGAIEGFSRYLKNPRAPKAEEATFLRGEAYFNTKRYKKAIVDFSAFPEKFSQSRRMPTALLRIGQSFEALGMKDDAKGFYQELVTKYPKSAEAKKARSKAK